MIFAYLCSAFGKEHIPFAIEKHSLRFTDKQNIIPYRNIISINLCIQFLN